MRFVSTVALLAPCLALLLLLALIPGCDPRGSDPGPVPKPAAAPKPCPCRPAPSPTAPTAATPDPSAPFTRQLRTPDGHSFVVASTRYVTGAFLTLPGKDCSLSVVSTSDGQNYAGYRDGKSQGDRLAIAIAPNGDVTLQVILPGKTGDSSRVRQVRLDQLDDLVRKAPPTPQ